MAQWYLYYQNDPKSHWHVCDASKRTQVLSEIRAPLSTVLDVNVDITDETPAEDIKQAKYTGPLYFDFDGVELEETTQHFHDFLTNLKAKGVDLSMLELFATGGRGYHILIPLKMLADRPNPEGYTNLPAIFREMAWELIVDSLDMNIYSAKKGRMFRNPNIQRENLKYKVPITLEQAFAMTPDLYDQLTSEPQLTPEVTKPKANAFLSKLFQETIVKIRSAVRKNTRIDNEVIREAFKGEFPDTFLQVAKEGLWYDEKAGFHKIAMQLALTATAIGKSEDEFIESCSGIINTYQGSDSNRYNSSLKRERELRRLYQYMMDNPCYGFTIGGLKSVLRPGAPTASLMVLNDPDDVLEDGVDEERLFLTKGTSFDTSGIFLSKFSKEDDKFIKNRVSDIGIDNVCILEDFATKAILHDGRETTGDRRFYEIDLYAKGQFKRRAEVPISAFFKTSDLQAILGFDGLPIHLSDSECKGLMQAVTDTALKNDQVKLVIKCEGVHVLTLRGSSQYDIVYVTHDDYGGVLSRTHGKYKRIGGNKCFSDLPDAPDLENTKEVKKFFDTFFKLNTPKDTARIFGYFLASFFASFFRFKTEKFPLLQVSGLAGSGKTSYVKLCAALHTYREGVNYFGAGGVTPWALKEILTTSSSTPCIMDEYKESEMTENKAALFKSTFRQLFDGTGLANGAISNEKGASGAHVVQKKMVAPLVFMSEVMITQAAIRDRCFSVRLDTKREFSQDFNYCKDNKQFLSALGKLIVNSIISNQCEGVYEVYQRHYNELNKMYGTQIADRPGVSNAIGLTALEYTKDLMGTIFHDYFDATFDQLIKAMRDGVADYTKENMLEERDEILNDLAFLSSGSAPSELLRLREGIDYAVFSDKYGTVFVDLELQGAFFKYKTYKASSHTAPKVSELQQLYNLFVGHPALVLDNVHLAEFPSALGKSTKGRKILRFDVEIMREMKLSDFSSSGKAVVLEGTLSNEARLKLLEEEMQTEDGKSLH